MVKIYDDLSSGPFAVRAHVDVTIDLCFGSNEEEAINSLRREVAHVITTLQNIDWTNIERVDVLGLPLNKRV